MRKTFLLLCAAMTLAACASGPDFSGNGDISYEQAAERRANVRALDNEDYAIARSRRRDAIEDYGDMRMREAEAINKAYENRSRQTIIVH